MKPDLGLVLPDLCAPGTSRGARWEQKPIPPSNSLNRIMDCQLWVDFCNDLWWYRGWVGAIICYNRLLVQLQPKALNCASLHELLRFCSPPKEILGNCEWVHVLLIVFFLLKAFVSHAYPTTSLEIKDNLGKTNCLIDVLLLSLDIWGSSQETLD